MKALHQVSRFDSTRNVRSLDRPEEKVCSGPGPEVLVANRDDKRGHAKRRHKVESPSQEQFTCCNQKLAISSPASAKYTKNNRRKRPKRYLYRSPESKFLFKKKGTSISINFIM